MGDGAGPAASEATSGSAASKVPEKSKSRTARDMEALIDKAALSNGIDPATLDGAGRDKLKAACEKDAVKGKKKRRGGGGGKKTGSVDLFKDSVANRARRNKEDLIAWQRKSDQCKRHKQLVSIERQVELKKMFDQRAAHLAELQRQRGIAAERLRVQRRWLSILKVMGAATTLKIALVEAGAQDAKAQQRDAAERERARARTEKVERDMEIERRARVATYGTEENIELRARCRAFSEEISTQFIDPVLRRKKFSANIIVRFLSDFAAESRKFMVVMKRFRAKVVVCQRVVRKHVHVRRSRLALLRQAFDKHASAHSRDLWSRAKESQLRQNATIMTVEARDALAALEVRRIPGRLAMTVIGQFYNAKHKEYAVATEIFMSGESAAAARSKFTAAEMRRLLSSEMSHSHELALLIYQKRRIKRPPFLFFSQLKANKHDILNTLVRQCYDQILLNQKVSTIHDLAMADTQDKGSKKDDKRWRF